MSDITALLERAREGERAALDEIFRLLYPQLRSMAHARLSGHQREPVVQTTMLVNECYLKLLAAGRLRPADRAHFLAYCAHVMRSVIIDAVRAAGRERRGGDAIHVTLDTGVANAAPVHGERVLEVDAALEDLARLDKRLATVVEMRYFAGMSEKEIAEALGVTDRTVRRDWQKARLLLKAALRD